MNAQTFAAWSGWGAALVAATVAGIQLYIGRNQAQAALTSAEAALMNAKNAGRYKIAEFRQNWINKVIDTLCEHHSIAMTQQADEPLPAGEHKKLASARTRLEILLNPDEPDTVSLLEAIDKIDSSNTARDREVAASEMLTIARRALKREWVRIKDELSHQPTIQRDRRGT
jgi:hypothetical protein